MIKTILDKLPLVVVPFVFAMWSLISAYVFKLGLRKSGIGLDYLVFTIVVVLCALAAGAL